MTQPAPPPSKPKKTKSKAKQSKSQRTSKRQKLSTGEASEVDGDGAVGDEKSHVEKTEDDGLGGAKWECLAISLEDYQRVLDSIKGKDEDEQILTERITEEILPDIEKAADAKARREAKRMRELQNLQKLASAKRSSRIADKTAKQREMDEAAEAERKKHEELEMAHKEAEKQRKMEEVSI